MEDKRKLSSKVRFTYIKEKTDTFSTASEKPCLPHEVLALLKERNPEHDFDAIKQIATQHLAANGVPKFIKDHNIPYDKKLYAILSSQFNNTENPGLTVNSIHKVKGLEDNAAYFIICKSLLDILIGIKNNYDKETNLLYVALTRSKNRLLLVIDDRAIDFEKDYYAELLRLGICKAKKEEWL